MFYDPPGELKNYGLRIRDEVAEAVLEYVGVCASCWRAPAPPEPRLPGELERWARDIAVLTPGKIDAAREDGHHLEYLARESQLTAVIGLPRNLLPIFITRLTDAQASRLIPFLETRFLFPLCQTCIKASGEQYVSESELKTRYRNVRREMAKHDLDWAPIGSDRYTDELFIILGLAIQERDSA